MKCPSKTTFILWPLAAKIVIKGGFFWYLQTAKDQNIHLRSRFVQLDVFWQLFRGLNCLGPKWSPKKLKSIQKASRNRIKQDKENWDRFLELADFFLATKNFSINNLPVICRKYLASLLWVFIGDVRRIHNVDSTSLLFLFNL